MFQPKKIQGGKSDEYGRILRRARVSEDEVGTSIAGVSEDEVYDLVGETRTPLQDEDLLQRTSEVVVNIGGKNEKFKEG